MGISTLELIAAGFLLLIAHLSGVTHKRMIVRCDNEAAFRVVNGHVADSVAMAEALVWFEAVQQYAGLRRCRIQNRPAPSRRKMQIRNGY